MPRATAKSKAAAPADTAPAAPALEVREMPVDSLLPYARNPRKNDHAVERVAAAIKEFGFRVPIIARSDGSIVDGHLRLKAAQKLGLATVPVVMADDMTAAQVKAFRISVNRMAELAEWDEELLRLEIEEIDAMGYDVDLTGFTAEDLSDLFAGADGGEGDGGGGGKPDPTTNGKLFEKFGVPPFTVLDSRQGYWQDRKAKWRELIGDNGESREETLFKAADNEVSQKMADVGTVSILDPVLAEILLRWFCPAEGLTFDTFAGDTIFGAVSAMLGRPFVGIELRAEQAALNNERTAGRGHPARYICDDGQNVLDHLAPESRDFFFSCPPYFDLEVYSDDPRDASNQGDYESFRRIIENAFTGAARVLKPNRFAAVVMSNVRDKRGFYHDICGDIRAIMRANGLHLYNELVLINVAGTAALRATGYMRNRKVARTHQEVMVFYKGQTGDGIYEAEGFDILGKLQAVQFHEDIMIFFKGDPASIKEEFGAITPAEVLGETAPEGGDDE